MTTPPQLDRGTPDVVYVPDFTRSLGAEACAVLDELGLQHQPWHDLVLHNAMALKESGNWLCHDVALVLPWHDEKQQNDQNVAFLRALVGAVLLTERVLYISDHLGAALIAFDALDALVDSKPVLSSLVSRIRRADGVQAVEFQGGGSIKFSAPGRHSRGLSADLLIADNAHLLHESFEDSVYPVLCAQANTQVWWIDFRPDGWRHIALCTRARVAVEQPAMYIGWNPK